MGGYPWYGCNMQMEMDGGASIGPAGTKGMVADVCYVLVLGRGPIQLPIWEICRNI